MPRYHPHIILEQERQRSIREYKTAGGGGTYPRKNYSRHAQKIFREAQELKNFIDESKALNPIEKVFFRIEVPKDFSVYGTSGEKLQENAMIDLIGSPQKNVGYARISKESFGLLLEQFTIYRDSKENRGKYKFAPIEKIGHIPLSEKLSKRFILPLSQQTAQTEYLITLFSELTREEISSYTEIIREFSETRSGEILSQTSSSSGILYRVRLSGKDVSTLADGIMAVQTVEPVDDFFTTSSIPVHRLDDQLIVEPVDTSAIVCLLDSGIVKGSRFIDSCIRGIEEPVGPPYSVGHGVFVASRIIYGDTLRDQIAAGKLSPSVKVLSVCVSTRDEIGNHKQPTVNELIPIIRDTVQRWHKEIRVFNLSLNIKPITEAANVCIADDIVSPLAAELDHLSRQHDVLFVLSAGNININTPPSCSYPQHFQDSLCRITPPAESLLSITVGSATGRDNEGSMAPKLHPSPFTRRGPGFAGFRKPDVAAHGGNTGKNWKTTEDLSTAGLDCTGQFLAYDNGTSHAAPLISRLAAQVFSALPDANSPLVRAIIVHFSSIPNDINSSDFLDKGSLPNLMGNGLPDIKRIVTSTSSAQSYLYYGAMDYRQIAKIPFYVPCTLCERQGKQVRLTYTLAYAPETNRNLKKGYCKSTIKANLFKRDGSGKLKKIPKGKEGVVLKETYSTIIQDNRTIARGSMGGDWEIQLEHTSRWKLRDNSVPFGLVITIQDPQEDEKVDIFESIQKEVPNRYQNQMHIRERMRF